MIKFQLFDSANSYQCHFSEISTFVVSISHYMRAYFNYQALKEGTEFQLPSDAAYLEVCVCSFFLRHFYEYRLSARLTRLFHALYLAVHSFATQFGQRSLPLCKGRLHGAWNLHVNQVATAPVHRSTVFTTIPGWSIRSSTCQPWIWSRWISRAVKSYLQAGFLLVFDVFTRRDIRYLQ